jgi:UDP-glucose 4-epimerase
MPLWPIYQSSKQKIRNFHCLVYDKHWSVIMKIFVVGGAGYIGSATAAMLLEAGHEVIVYDSLVKGYAKAVPAGAHFIHADLADTVRLEQALSDHHPDAVMQFAAFIEAGESMLTPGKFFENNLSNTIRLLDAMVKTRVNQIVFSSTAGIFASSDAPLKETSPVGPASVYGHSKLMVEQALDWYQKIYGLRFAALRYFNAAGALPGRGEAHQPESHLIPLVLQVALGQRENISIFGTDYPTPDGTNIRDYIHIRDLVSAHLLALEGLKKQEKLVYNLGNGKGYSVRQVIETARKITGKSIPAIESPRRAGDAPRLVACADRIKKELGWQPQIPNLDEIIATAWEWHRTHPHGWRS